MRDISMSSKIGFVAVSMVLLILAGCAVASSPPVGFTSTPAPDVVIHESFSSSVVFADLPDGLDPGWGMGFARPEHLSIPPFDRPQNEEFRLSDGETFSPYLIIGGNFDEPMRLLVTVFLDYQQVSFELDGKTGILHQLDLPANVELNLPMKLTINQPGAHDLFVIAFADPDEHTLDAEARILQHDGLTGRRAVVVVGDDEDPFKVLLPDMMGAPIPESNYDYLRVALATLPDNRNDVFPADRQLIVTPVSRDDDFLFQVIAKNEDEAYVEYAMVTFLDFRQVALNEAGVLLASFGPGEEATFDGKVHIPDVVGVHELQVVYIMDPYKSILRDEVTASFVFGSVRVGLQVP